jgi:hypothetical protein
MKRASCYASLLLFVALSNSLLAVDKQALTAANAAVEANLKTPEGKKYEQQLGTELPTKYVPALRQCKQSVGNSSGFDMFLKLNADGKVQQALIYPENAFTTCARNGASNLQLSAPPHGDYWINVHM